MLKCCGCKKLVDLVKPSESQICVFPVVSEDPQGGSQTLGLADKPPVIPLYLEDPWMFHGHSRGGEVSRAGSSLGSPSSQGLNAPGQVISLWTRVFSGPHLELLAH